MPKMVFTDAYVSINAVDLSSMVRRVALNIESEQVDVTSMGNSGYRDRLGGMKEWTAEVEFFQNFDAGSVDATLAPLFGTVTACAFRPSKAGAISATNPEYQGNGTVLTHSPISGTVNEALATVVRITGSGPLVRDVTP